MQWPSAAILAYIHAGILSAEYGCDVEVVTGDLNATTSSMATTGRPMVAPEVWLGRVAAIWNSARETGHVRRAAPTFSGGDMEAWFVPDYVAEDNPGLQSAADLLDHWQVFTKGGKRASFLSCPPDWACAVINRNLLRAFGLTVRFDVYEPESRFEIDNTIAEAVSRHEPILFYYWQPNGVLAQFGFVPLDMGAYDARAVSCLASTDCLDPTPSSFPAEQVVIAISDDLFELSPTLAAYFQRATMPLSEMNALLAFMSESGGTPEQAARHFITTRSEIWANWLDL
jgi:glycine betaine/proline transport system substrate-binding protein